MTEDGCLDVLVSGYASIDLAWQVNTPPHPGQTSLLSGAVNPREQRGGCGPRVALTLASLGLRTGVMSWLGDDPPGRKYAQYLKRCGVDIRGLVLAYGERSPRCFLFYDPSGAATCCYHPSGSLLQTLDEAGRCLAAQSGALAITVGPAALTSGLLDARPTHSLVAWSVKADPDAFPPDLRCRLLREARIVCLNWEEIPFVLEATGVPESTPEAVAAHVDGVTIVTRGAFGAIALWGGKRVEVQPEYVELTDPTGAGDSFFAAFLAAALGGATPPDALRSATDYVSRMLKQRMVLA